MVKKKVKKVKKIDRGQVSLFILIAIIIVAVIIIIFLSINFNQIKLPLSPDVDPVYESLRSCISETGKNAIIETGVHGGYFEIGYATPGGTPYYYDYKNSTYYVPSKQELEEQLNLYMNVFLNTCDLAGFKNFEIDKGHINTTAIIKDNNVIFNVDYPLTIMKGSKTYHLKTFDDISIPVRLGIIQSSIADYFNKSKLHPDGICLTCLYDIGKKNELYFELYDYDENTVLYLVRDKKVPVKNFTSYQFNFAAKYPRINHLTANSTVVIK